MDWTKILSNLQVEDAVVLIRTTCCRRLLFVIASDSIQRGPWKHEGLLWGPHPQIPPLTSSQLRCIPTWRCAFLLPGWYPKVLREDFAGQIAQPREASGGLRFDSIEEWDVLVRWLTYYCHTYSTKRYSKIDKRGQLSLNLDIHDGIPFLSMI